MSLEAPAIRFRSRVTGGPPRSRRPGHAFALSAVAVLALAASSCQSGTSPSSSSSAYLVFTVQPPSYSGVGQALSPAVRVSVVDAARRTLTSFSADVTLTLGANVDSAAVLSGRTTVATAGGVATFSDLRVDRRGEYFLVATGGGLPSTGSAPFEVDLYPPTRQAGTPVTARDEGRRTGVDLLPAPPRR